MTEDLEQEVRVQEMPIQPQAIEKKVCGGIYCSIRIHNNDNTNCKLARTISPFKLG